MRGVGTKPRFWHGKGARVPEDEDGEGILLGKKDSGGGSMPSGIESKAR